MIVFWVVTPYRITRS